MADANAHPTACIDDGARIGPDTSVWHFCHIMSSARIGAGRYAPGLRRFLDWTEDAPIEERPT